MYSLERTGQIYRKEPWRKPLEERLAALKKARLHGRKTVAFLYPYFDSSTFRYRGYNIAETLEYSLCWSGAYFELEDLQGLWKELDSVDVLVVIRCAWNEELEAFLDRAKANGIKVCYDVDDLIYHPKHMPGVIHALGITGEAEWNYWFGLTERNRMVAQMCDAAITTNAYLGRYIGQDFHKPYYIIKNYLNWIQEEVSGTYFAAKRCLKAQRPFEIGYFSGSPTHVKDLMAVMPEMEEFLNRHEDARFKIAGYMDLPDLYTPLVQKRKIQFVPFQTIAGLQYEQAKVDVNIVPLVNNEFSNCKSELKYFEAAAVGTITCATPGYAYANVITHGENGYLCQTGEWLPVFERLYEAGVPKEQQEYIREKALEEYSFKRQLQSVEKVFEEIYKACDSPRRPADPVREGKRMEHQALEQKPEENWRLRIEEEIEARKYFEEKYYLCMDELQEAREAARAAASVRMEDNGPVRKMGRWKVWKKKCGRKLQELRLLHKKISYWEPVFDARYYARVNEDIMQIFGPDERSLLKHFIYYGMDEGRMAKEGLDMEEYVKYTPELADRWTKDRRACYLHYIAARKSRKEYMAGRTKDGK